MDSEGVFWLIFWGIITLIAVSIAFTIVGFEYVESDYKECVKTCDYVEDTFIAGCISACNEIILNKSCEEYNGQK